ncbi:hypothetical protein C1Y40_05556 [Mycobacterium talmoniae]|uniref:Uncharacterized protein n=1 Tax=Mycobacterium talmoniae TaxID=1858794 RepID=A0A2S8BCA1_9MYCO|nr:hypothetical protein C1Y40_05556 [Mycobacterium talmoniae]
MVPAGHCSTSSSLARVRSRGQLRPFSNAISAPALMILYLARLRWVISSSRRRLAAAAPARSTPGSMSVSVVSSMPLRVRTTSVISTSSSNEKSM